MLLFKVSKSPEFALRPLTTPQPVEKREHKPMMMLSHSSLVTCCVSVRLNRRKILITTLITFLFFFFSCSLPGCVFLHVLLTCARQTLCGTINISDLLSRIIILILLLVHRDCRETSSTSFGKHNLLTSGDDVGPEAISLNYPTDKAINYRGDRCPYSLLGYKVLAP